MREGVRGANGIDSRPSTKTTPQSMPLICPLPDGPDSLTIAAQEPAPALASALGYSAARPSYFLSRQ